MDNSQKNYMTDDSNAPLLYTKRYITLMGGFSNPIIAGIFLTMNLYQLGQKKNAWYAFSTCVIFGIALAIAVSMIKNSSPILISIPLGALIASAIQHFFWKHIPYDLKFRKRNILKPTLYVFVPQIILIILTFWDSLQKTQI